MQHKSPTVDDVIAALEHFRAGTGMYIYPVDVPHTRSFLVGFVVGLRAGGIAIEGELRSQVQRDRGREERPFGPVPQMEEKGMTQRQIIDELIDIEIEAWRRSLVTR